jgi:Putative metallopeptidase
MRHFLKTLFCTATILAATTVSGPEPAAAQTGTVAGKINVRYDPGADEISEQLAKLLADEKIFETLSVAIDETVRLPRDLDVVFRNCGAANAFYDPAQTGITMCYELIAMIGQTAANAGQTDDEIGQNFLGTAAFFFLHELGHALVHQLDLPITGKEEDAVDDIATLLILEADEDNQGAKMLAAAAGQFGELAAKKEKLDDLPFWDEHSLDAQRMYHVICMIYGSNPKAYPGLVGDDLLPKQRAERCPSEFQQRQRSWQRLLKDNLKSAPPTTG